MQHKHTTISSGRVSGLPAPTCTGLYIPVTASVMLCRTHTGITGTPYQTQAAATGPEMKSRGSGEPGTQSSMCERCLLSSNWQKALS